MQTARHCARNLLHNGNISQADTVQIVEKIDIKDIRRYVEALNGAVTKGERVDAIDSIEKCLRHDRYELLFSSK
jgi:hypothetical protein